MNSLRVNISIQFAIRLLSNLNFQQFRILILYWNAFIIIYLSFKWAKIWKLKYWILAFELINYFIWEIVEYCIIKWFSLNKVGVFMKVWISVIICSLYISIKLLEYGLNSFDLNI